MLLSTGSLFGTAGGGAIDPYLSSVVLLPNFNGVDGATTALDNSASAHTLTFTGSAQIDTGVLTPWGHACVETTTLGSVACGDSADWRFPGEFTIEGFLRPSSLSNTMILFGQSAETGQRSIRQYLLNTKVFNANFWVTDVSSATHTLTTAAVTAITVGTWFHWAFTRDAASKMRLFIDGVMVASKTSATGTNFDSTSTLRLGVHENSLAYWQGHRAEDRWTKGVCRYDSDGGFTPPSGPFPRR